LDSFAAASCDDPGVDRNPKVALVRTREALADCEQRRALAVDSYDGIRRAYGPKAVGGDEET